MTPSDSRRRTGERGLVLLEILVALAIFTFVVLAWMQAADNAVAAAAAANQERLLRMLAARKLDEIRAKPAEYQDGWQGGFEEEVDGGEDNPFLDYACKVEPLEFVAAGRADEEGAAYLFARDEDAATDPPPAAAGEAGKAAGSKPVVLLRFLITVSHIPEGADGEEFRVIAFVPKPKEETK